MVGWMDNVFRLLRDQKLDRRPFILIGSCQKPYTVEEYVQMAFQYLDWNVHIDDEFGISQPTQNDC